MSETGVRRDKAALSIGYKPTRQSLQPEAIGAVMEVTKWLKPSISVYEQLRIRFCIHQNFPGDDFGVSKI
jgi:hypothetical protein